MLKHKLRVTERHLGFRVTRLSVSLQVQGPEVAYPDPVVNRHVSLHGLQAPRSSLARTRQ
jgi:hypothetical protein